mmetsp:Transcript_22617/g.57915  ORF Transcript_22617/g.57915 Transcript_22617/m.57915 type:complete len:364 (-) Transcript_22617:629-1720(-)
MARRLLADVQLHETHVKGVDAAQRVQQPAICNHTAAALPKAPVHRQQRRRQLFCGLVPRVVGGGALAGQDVLHALACAHQHAPHLTQHNAVWRGGAVVRRLEHLIDGRPGAAALGGCGEGLGLGLGHQRLRVASHGVALQVAALQCILAIHQRQRPRLLARDVLALLVQRLQGADQLVAVQQVVVRLGEAHLAAVVDVSGRGLKRGALGAVQAVSVLCACPCAQDLVRHPPDLITAVGHRQLHQQLVHLSNVQASRHPAGHAHHVMRHPVGDIGVAIAVTANPARELNGRSGDGQLAANGALHRLAQAAQVGRHGLPQASLHNVQPAARLIHWRRLLFADLVSLPNAGDLAHQLVDQLLALHG